MRNESDRPLIKQPSMMNFLPLIFVLALAATLYTPGLRAAQPWFVVDTVKNSKQP